MKKVARDYGYIGDGIDGYVHYKQAFDENFKDSGGGGGGGQKPSGGRGKGWIIAIIAAIIIIVLLSK